MSSKREDLTARDFIIGLLASGLSADEVAKIVAFSKKGMDRRFKKGIDASWKPADLKKIRDQLFFGKWSWFDQGVLFRQSWDGSITQDVNFFYPFCGIKTRLSSYPKSQRGFNMLVSLAEKSVADREGEAEVEIFLTEEQIEIFFSGEEV